MVTYIDYLIRDWGKWYVLDDLGTTKIKRMEVDPGSQLSYQKHVDRSEFWFVHSGTGIAIVSEDLVKEEQVVLTKGVSIHIPKRKWHQLINTGKDVLVIIEIQYGKECKESDIVRRPNPEYDNEDAMDKVVKLNMG